MSYSWGVWVTAYARFNLLSNLVKLDNYCLYTDTDSLKLEDGFNRQIIRDYNTKVIFKIKKVCEDLKLDINRFMPKDKDGIKHIIGLFEDETKDGEKYTYKEFITLGAKKYAYKDFKDEIHITVSGVPKQGAKALKDLKDFKSDFVFEFRDTNKNMISYNDCQDDFELIDFKGNKLKLTDRFGACLIPTTYSLGISDEYFELISNESSSHSIYIE